ncbi:ergothioneine biosynthesis protein EgtB [Marinococcus halophilus]|uniref:ergothioneine biosynthesis protein EgtB n=1 Tax=Marinococcus halophilus TaxID=1371 RepID=UPI002467C08D|nr:ergothioneine biosynthesis protein EgtB [Marinococcus halophilus]
MVQTKESATRADFTARFTALRKQTMKLTAPLYTEDFMIQAHPDVSPAKWHLAHTTWFFEQFILKPYDDNYEEFSKFSNGLYNSYYETQGKPFPKQYRGLISRPTTEDTMEYRRHVEEAMEHFLQKGPWNEEIAELMETGLQHEQQHQELLVTDTKFNFSMNPLNPAYLENESFEEQGETSKLEWHAYEDELTTIGTDNLHFSFDNERPEHKFYLHAFSIASRPVTNEEYIRFIEDGGYEDPELWLSEGWGIVQEQDWKAPLYWQKQGGIWFYFTMNGLKEVRLHEPIAHISYYEADAYARWAGARLPTEQEWEYAFRGAEADGTFLESESYHPRPLQSSPNAYGDVWEWTRSPYSPYPGNRPPEGAMGEYNAKFMSNQMVLRGGSCATPKSHIRSTYRNFFPPEKRWQFSGLRLAKDGVQK